jgi:hypothetical protein
MAKRPTNEQMKRRIMVLLRKQALSVAELKRMMLRRTKAKK